MASRARIQPVQPAPAADPAEENNEITTGDLTPDDDGEGDALAELRGVAGGADHKFTVSRVSSSPGRPPGYCRVYAVGDLSLDSIREEFGGGKYRVRVTDSAGRFVTQQTVDIVDLPKKETPAPINLPQGADLQGIASILSAVKPAAGGDGLASVLSLIMAQQKSTTEMIVAMMNRPVEKGPSIVELLALLKGNKEESGIDTLLKGIELGKSLSGGGGETGVLDIAKEGLGFVSQLVQQQKAAQSAAPVATLPHTGAPAQIAPIPNATAPAPVAPLAEGANVSVIQQIQFIKKQVEVLLHHAARDKNPELYAEVMLDNLPPYITPEVILQHIGADDAIAKLALLDSRVTQYAEWFEEFRQHVIAFLTPDADERPDAGGADGVDLDNPVEGAD